jgi:ATP-dependent Lon protease
MNDHAPQSDGPPPAPDAGPPALSVGVPSAALALSLPVLPIKNLILYPHLHLPLVVGRPVSLAGMEAASMSEDKALVVVAQRDGAVDDPTSADLYAVGTQAVIKKMERAENAVHLIVQGVRRVAIERVEHERPFIKAVVRPLPEPTDSGTEVEALHRAIHDQVGKIHNLVQPQSQVTLGQFISQFRDPLHQAYLLGSMLTLDLAKEQALLEAPTRAEGLRLMHDYLTHEVQVLELRQEITNEATTEMSREQREYLLRQQMRAIQEELGEQSPEQAEAAELRQRLTQADLPDRVRTEAERELKRLERLPTAAPDYQLTRTYLELVLELPWRKTTEDVLDLPRARQVLDEDHYGLADVKERIVEHLAVLKLNPQAKAPILCFVGPPGVGKTSLGKSIARAVGRTFERISLGGLHDESELRGHRRTYIGAMPGRIVQAIRRAGVNNPLLMLDEIDKLGRGFHGDPAAALLEVLDPAQNHEFHDNYLDVAFDLSKVFFVTTANTLDSIPQPLLDRMELLRLAGYTAEEKTHIAVRYLIPRQLAETGLAQAQVSILPQALDRVIHRYTREAGVRQLDRTLGRLCRKAAVQFAEGRSEPLAIDADMAADLLGPERFFLEEARRELPPGVATGLAWTEAGGEVLYVETVLLPGGKGLNLTGQLGEVMRESAHAAQSFLWSHAAELGIEKQLVRESGVHVHVPAGAVPKDGPSAGVAMAAALASLYTRQPARADTAMTGEITLTGLVLPIGGVKEKVLAAQRAGIRRVILPQENRKDLRDIPDEARRELEFIFAARVEDALAAAIPALAERMVGVGA